MSPPKVIKGAGVLEVANATVTAKADIRVNMAVSNLLSSATLCRQVGEVERANAGKDFGGFWQDIFANASGSVFTAVASLESYANELFIDRKQVFPEFREDVMDKLWELYEQKSILEKFEFALLLKNAPAFDRGGAPYQGVDTIIQLRNALMHFKPEWLSMQKKHANLSIRLKQNATLSPFFSSIEPLFPRGWASHATVQWVIRNTLEFMLEFERRTGVNPKMTKFKNKFENT